MQRSRVTLSAAKLTEQTKEEEEEEDNILLYRRLCSFLVFSNPIQSNLFCDTTQVKTGT